MLLACRKARPLATSMATCLPLQEISHEHQQLKRCGNNSFHVSSTDTWLFCAWLLLDTPPLHQGLTLPPRGPAAPQLQAVPQRQPSRPAWQGAAAQGLRRSPTCGTSATLAAGCSCQDPQP
jgi:hypothetical protein